MPKTSCQMQQTNYYVRVHLLVTSSFSFFELNGALVHVKDHTSSLMRFEVGVIKLVRTFNISGLFFRNIRILKQNNFAERIYTFF